MSQSGKCVFLNWGADILEVENSFERPIVNHQSILCSMSTSPVFTRLHSKHLMTVKLTFVLSLRDTQSDTCTEVVHLHQLTASDTQNPSPVCPPYFSHGKTHADAQRLTWGFIVNGLGFFCQPIINFPNWSRHLIFPKKKVQLKSPRLVFKTTPQISTEQSLHPQLLLVPDGVLIWTLCLSIQDIL